MTDRRNRLATNREGGQAFNDRLFVAMYAQAAAPVHYPDGDVYKAIDANDSDPNVSDPAASRVLLGAPESGAAPISHVAVIPVVITQAAKVRVWARTQVPAATLADFGWVPIETITLAGDGTDDEIIVPVGARDVFVQVVSGADAGHPLTLAVAAC